MMTPVSKFELWLWTALPVLITIMLALFCLASKHISGLDHFMPTLPLIPVFYWGLTHAREMPYWFVFLLGLITDAVMGMPLGLSSLLYICFLGLLHAQRKFIIKEGFVIKWGYFALLLGLMDTFNWSIVSFFNGQAASFQPAFIQWVLTVCCYPLLHKIFDSLCDYIHSRRWHILHGH